MWFVFSLLSGALYTAQGLLTRYVLRNKNDAWAFSFYFSAVGALVSLPFMLVNLKLSSALLPWVLMIIVGFLIVGQNLLNFASSKYLEASIQGSITKFRLVWGFIFGIIILGETLTVPKVIGVTVTVLAGLIIIKKFKKPESTSGVVLAFFATILYAVVVTLYKFLFSSFNSASLTFFIFFIPAILNLVIMPQSITRIKKLAKENGPAVFVACAFGGFANLAMNQALSIGELSRVIVIIEAFLVVTLVGEHLWLKEKDHLVTKPVAVGLATIGAILIRIK